jgi:CelD/BcsL family acetyltransferase involved in cellulose biosynthesis
VPIKVTSSGAPRFRHEVRDLERSRSDWPDLLTKMRGTSFYHRLEWFEAASVHLAAEMEFHWFIVEGQPAAVLPLQASRESTRRFTGLQLPDHPDLFLRDFLVVDHLWNLDWASVLAHQLRSGSGAHPCEVRFHRVPGRSTAGAVLRAEHKLVRKTPRGRRFFCPVREPADLEALSAKHLRNVARLGRKAERELGAVERVVYAGPLAPSVGLDTFSAVEASSWKGPAAANTSLSCQPVAFAFYREVLRRFSLSQDARVDVLTIAGEPAAALLAVRAGAQWSLLKIGYDERFAGVGPGSVLLLRFLQEMGDTSDVEEVSLVTDPAWADRWHFQAEPIYDIALFGRSLCGRIRSVRHDALGIVRRLRSGTVRSSGRWSFLSPQESDPDPSKDLVVGSSRDLSR